MEEEKRSPSPRKRVSFSSNITTYEHVSVYESIESLVECNEDIGIANHSDLKSTNPVNSLSEANSSDISTVGSFPPNHRYHNARESDDEADVYGDSDLENLDEDEHIDYEPVLASSMEVKRENYAIEEEVQSHFTLKIQPPDSPIDGIDHIDYVVNSIENVSKSKAVDASLSYWLDSPDTMIKKARMSTSLPDDCNLKENFEDRPILGALTVEEVRQISVASTPRKSPNRSPDVPIIGTVGTFWNHSTSAKHSDSASPDRGLPNTTSKYREVSME